MTMIETTAVGARIDGAVVRNTALTSTGILERVFSAAFRGLVYPQIWEDPLIDMEALALKPSDTLVTIASGSCNVMSYLTANPAEIIAVDLSLSPCCTRQAQARRSHASAGPHGVFQHLPPCQSQIQFGALPASHPSAPG